MIKSLLKIGVALSLMIGIASASETLAIVNGHKVTTEVAPRNFAKLNKKIQKKIINRLVEERLACDYALSSNIVKSKKFLKILKHIKTIPKGKWTKEQLYNKKGLLAFGYLINEKFAKLKFTNKELEKYYKIHKYKYDTIAYKDLAIIVVNTKKEANKIISKLQKSKNIEKDFMNMAKKYSLAPSAKDNGYFGKIATMDLNPQLKPILKNMKRGAFTAKPIKTAFGYEIYYVVNDIPAFNSKFNLVKDHVKQDLRKQTIKNWAVSTIRKLKSKAKITIVQQ